MRGTRRRYALLLGIVALVELVYALYNPPYNYPDERSHLQCISFYREEGRLPDPYTRGEKIQQDKHPPYLYSLGALTLAASDGLFDDAEFSLPGPYDRRWELGREQSVRVDPKARKVADGQLLLLRFLMIAHWLLAAAFFLACADLVFVAHKRWAFAIALGAATLPQAALGGAAVTPDTPLVAFCAGAWFFLLRAMLGPNERDLRRDALFGGGLWALALLSKAAAVFFVPVLLVAALRVARASSTGDPGRGLEPSESTDSTDSTENADDAGSKDSAHGRLSTGRTHGTESRTSESPGGSGTARLGSRCGLRGLLRGAPIAACGLVVPSKPLALRRSLSDACAGRGVHALDAGVSP